MTEPSDQQHAEPGNALFSLPEPLRERSESMHACALVIGRFGLLLRGGTGSGKSVLQRQLRREARAQGLYSALVSDDYVRLARPQPPAISDRENPQEAPLLAFGPVATRGLEEVRGLGIIPVADEEVLPMAVMHLLVDLVEAEDLPRMPSLEQTQCTLVGQPIPRMAAPRQSAVAARDLIFARLAQDGLRS